MFPKLGNSFMDINKIERKLNKLKREPDIFIKDMIANKKNNITSVINKIKPVKLKTKNKYTIVSAIYNVEKYLDEYFSSIINQSISFKESIYIICVDDGSTDNSAKIIKKWQKKYPKNIQYIYKENGGQSSARNMGLEFVKTDWVTMIDPDDFLHSNFFWEIDKAINQNKNVKLVAPNFIFYFEDQKNKKDTHPLKYRFKTTTIVNNRKLEKNIHMHAASTIFNYNLIKNKNIYFNIDLKPNFEDGKFVADYLINCLDSDVVFSKEAIYYYRKRSDQSSTLDTAWKKPEKFYNTLKYGYLDMLVTYQNKIGYIPKNIQYTVIYDTYWFVKNLENQCGKTDFLTFEQKYKFHQLLKEIYSFIDDENIISFNMSGIWFKHKVGMLGKFKNSKPNFQICYVDNIDKDNNQICISCFFYGEMDVSFRVNENDTIPIYYKKINTTFVSEYFVTEYRAWINYQELSDKLEVLINCEKAKISVLGEQHGFSISFDKILKKFTPSLKYDVDNSWIFIDRDSQADDNAEHLYRYILENNLKDECYFALNKNSKDWIRLEEEGFNLIDFGSLDFESKLRKCSKIISSNIDHYIDNYFGDHYEYSKKIVFLQHGVIKDDLSKWLNTKKNLQCFITSTQKEYESIVNDFSRYKSSKKEVFLTGLPRHDYLIEYQDTCENIILIMPTWRSSIVGKTIDNSNKREMNIDFFNSEFCMNWKLFLNSDYLKKMVNDYNYQIIFAPHINMTPYIQYFNVPSYIDIWSKMESNQSIQELFINSKILVTDYSSVAFEMAYLEKPIVYFQFDKETIFSGNHTYQKGYFEYERDGFGPVVEKVEEVEKALEQILQNEGKPLEPYLNRMQQTFTFKDGRCCERTYNAILALDEEDNTVDLELALTFLTQAYDFKNYELVCKRAENILLHPELDESQKISVYEKLAESYLELKNWDALTQLLNQYSNQTVEVKLLAAQEQWEQVIDTIGYNFVLDQYIVLRLSGLFNLKLLNSNLLSNTEIDQSKCSELENYICKAYVFYSQENWEDLINILDYIKSYLELNNLSIEAYTQQDFDFMYLMSAKNLNCVTLELITTLNSKKPDFILEKAILLSNLNELDTAIQNFEAAKKVYEPVDWGIEAIKQYVFALYSKKRWENLVDVLPLIIENNPSEILFRDYLVQALGHLAQWNTLISFVKNDSISYSSEAIYFIILAYYRIGEIDRAYEILEQPTPENIYEYWLLALEIYMQMDDHIKATYCLKRMYAIFPEKIQMTKDKFDLLSQAFLVN